MAKNTPELTTDQCRAFIDELSRMEVFQINFGGGEPFLRDDFVDILDYAQHRGITTCVSTNGVSLDKSLARRLAQMDLLRIQVSLDGATALTNDAIRGEGTYVRILEGIELLKMSGIANLSINTVVTRINYSEIGALLKLARFYKINTRLSRFRPAGDGKKMWQEYCLTREQLAGLSEFLHTHREVMTGDSFFAIIDGDRRDMGLNICGAARMTCSVLPDGGVYPCAFLRDEQFWAGHIAGESLGHIWLYAPIFRRLRSIRVQSCETCIRFTQCHGGCPAVAYFLLQSLGQPDPECIASFRGE